MYLYMCVCFFDAAFVPTPPTPTTPTHTKKALRWWLGGLGFFFGLLGLVSLTSPGAHNPVVRICMYICI